MTQPVTLPLWLLLVILAFAAVTALSHFLLPSVRWFFRKRAERVVTELNKRLARPIEPFKLARRHDMIQRLLYDPEVTHAVVEESRTEGVPENVAFQQARAYAREIVPSFSATAYFSIGMRLARWLSTSTYEVRIGSFDREALSAIDPDATVIFVMNHRSNMDYVLVTWLVSRASAMSYAVGEWARIWPLSSLIKMMGAYFIRRRSRGHLYRRVLARYVQMATENGVTQAFFPEGGLSLDGHTAAPKHGLLDYVTRRGEEGRDVIFVPVGLNYDRILEDRVLIAAQGQTDRRFSVAKRKIARALLGHLRQRLTGRFAGFGIASVSFGKPLHLGDHKGDTEDLARELMARISAIIPLLPVPITARALLEAGGPATQARVQALVEDARDRSHRLPVSDAADVFERGITALRERDLIIERPDGPYPKDDRARRILAFYAASAGWHPHDALVSAAAK